MTMDIAAAEGDAAAGRTATAATTTQARILVVEDDDNIAALLARELRGLGHTVDAVRYAEDALFAARANDYALMIVDLGLPDGDGLDLVREMRRRSVEAPILMLTARRRVEDRVVGLSSGADDYLVKPFAVPEMRARVTALLRRPSRLRGHRISIANVVVDSDALEAVVDGVSLALPRKQFQLLELLARRKNHMTPKRMIEETLYGFDDDVTANSIEAQISKLRRALAGAGAGIAIETRRGIGYRLVGARRSCAALKPPTAEPICGCSIRTGSFRRGSRPTGSGWRNSATMAPGTSCGGWCTGWPGRRGRSAMVRSARWRLALDDKFVAGERVLPVDVARLVAALEQALGKPEKSA